jgi:hypothetical protein
MSFSNILRVCLLAAIVSGPDAYSLEQNHRTLRRTSDKTKEEKSAIASELISVVDQFIEAGQSSDPRNRSKYLTARVFYHGHALTQGQAEGEILSLYRRWPTRKYGPLEEPEIFQIPKKSDVYKVTGTYEYELSNPNERLVGKSKITCILEHGGSGNRIIGLDENLISDTTRYSRY